MTKTSSPFTRIDLRRVQPAGGVDLRFKSADVLGAADNMAIVNVEVGGAVEGIRFDVGKRIFLDSLGTDRLDKAARELSGPIADRIGQARRRALATGRVRRARPPRLKGRSVEAIG